MVSATEVPSQDTSVLGHPTELLTMRLCGTELDGRVVRIRSAKCTIGADRSCTLRLRGPGVRPFHCVILRGPDGTIVRRLSTDTCLNGCGFDVARLEPNDRLAIGPLELQILPPTPLPEPARAITVADQPDQPEQPDLQHQPEQLEQLKQPETADSQWAERCALLEQQLHQSQGEQQRLQGALAEAQAVLLEARTAIGRLGPLESELVTLRGDLEIERAAVQDARNQLEAQRDAHAEREAAWNARDNGSPDANGQSAVCQTGDDTNWKDIAEKLRAELQQTREEHRRVREEWHADRHSLEQQLSRRSQSLKDLDHKFKQDMREAETLIHSMQQEGKHLLSQLEEARLTIHQDVDRRKKRQSLAQSPAPADVPAPPALPLRTPSPQPPQTPGQPELADAVPDQPAANTAAPVDATLVMDPEQLASLGPQPPTDQPPAPADPPEAASAPPPADTPEDDDGVIQRYMERLLRRVARAPE